MHGLINRALEQLVTQRYGAETWDKVRSDAAMDDEVFIAHHAYPDALTFRLVDAACARTGADRDELLKAFGHHWALHTVGEVYAELLDSVAGDFETLLRNVSAVHDRVRISQPEANPPRMEIVESGEGWMRLTYESPRDGLRPIVRGILTGFAERFGLDADIQCSPRPERPGTCMEYLIRWNAKERAA